jgi:predicted transcriptional regulator
MARRAKHFAKLTESQVIYMRQERKKGRRVKDIALEMGISPQNAGRAINGQTWKYVKEVTSDE